MPLRLSLKAGERVIVNGSVLRNDGRRTTITVENRAQILRGAGVMSEDEANTPTKRAYFAVQCMLIDPSSDGRHGKKAMELLASLYAALSDDTVRKAVVDAAAQAASGDYYKALTSLRPVITYEATALARVDTASTVGDTKKN